MRKYIILVGLLMVLFCGSAQAIDITTFNNPEELVLKDTNTVMVIHDSTSMSEMYLDADCSSSLKLTNFTSLRDIGVDSQGRLIVAMWPGSGDGFVYRLNYPVGITDWNDVTPSQRTLLGSFGAGVMDIEIDANDNVYVLSGDSLFVLNAPAYTTTLLHDFDTTPLQTMTLHPDGIGISHSKYVGTITSWSYYSYFYNPNTDQVTTIYSDTAGYDNTWLGISTMATASNGDIYAGIDNPQNAPTIGNLEDQTSIFYFNSSDMLDQNVIYNGVTEAPQGMVIDSNGVIYVAYTDLDQISTYATVGGYGGYNFAPTTGGEVDNSISSVTWDSNYVLDDVGTFTWNVDSTNWADDDYIYKCIVTRISDNGQYDQGVYDSGELTSQTGSKDIIFDTATSYKVQLKKYSKADLYIGIIFEPDILDTDVITITAGGQSQINAPSTGQRGQAFNISYNYGYTPQDPEIRIKKLEGIQYNVINTIATTASPEAGTTYTTQGTIYETGYYVVELYDNAKGSQATDSIEIIYTYVPPTNPINDNFINAKSDSYALGEYCRGSYAVDDTNYTTYDVRLEVYNTDKSIMAFSVPATQQLNAFDIGLFDYQLYDDGEQLHPVKTNFMSGAHDVRLTGYYSNGTQALIINSDSITITDTTTEGYGLILSKGEVDQAEKFIISAISPTSANVIIRDENDILIKSMSINGSIDIPYSLAKPGYYTIELLKDQELKAHQLLKVRDTGADWMPGETGTTNSDSGTAMYMNFINFMTKPIFWGIIIYAGLVGGIAQIKDVNKSSLGLIAFIFLNLFAIAGLFAPYTAYVLVMGWIGAGIFFSLGRRMAGGDI